MSGHSPTERPSTAPVIFSAEDILAKMRDGVKSTSEIRLRKMSFPVRILSIDETNAIRREAIREAKLGNGDEVDRNLAIEKSTLMLASTPPGGGPGLPDKVLGLLTVDELHHLYNEYVKIMDDVNPAVEDITQEQVKALVEAIKKNSVSARDLSLWQLRVIFSLFQDAVQRAETQDSPKDN
jgi:hypothetical protein